MRIDKAFRIKDGDVVSVGDRKYDVLTVSVVFPSPVCPGRDEVEVRSKDGKLLRLWADQSVLIATGGDE